MCGWKLAKRNSPLIRICRRPLGQNCTFETRTQTAPRELLYVQDGWGRREGQSQREGKVWWRARGITPIDAQAIDFRLVGFDPMGEQFQGNLHCIFIIQDHQKNWWWCHLNDGEQVLLKLPFLRILHREPGSAHLNSPHVALHSMHITIIIKQKDLNKMVAVFLEGPFIIQEADLTRLPTSFDKSCIILLSSMYFFFTNFR